MSQANGTYIWSESKNDWEWIGNAAAIQGEKGEPGEPGPAGVQGERGQDGIIGPQGLTGATGAQGIPGEKGEKGDPGEKGEQGDVGPAGATGEKGDPGEKGEKGDPGLPGEKGEKGDPGELGLDGNPGLPGKDGKDGSHFCQYYDSGFEKNDFLFNNRAQKAYILPKTATTGDVCFSYKFRCYVILGEDRGSYFEVDPASVFYLPSGAPGPAGNMVAWRVSGFEFGPSPESTIINAMWLTNIRNAAAFYRQPAKEVGQFFYVTAAGGTMFGIIGGFGTWNGTDNVPFAYMEDVTSIYGTAGLPGRSVQATTAELVNGGTYANSTLISGGSPSVGDVVINTDTCQQGSIVSVGDNNYTVGRVSTNAIQGPAGQDGETGARGEKGDRGEQGIQGIRGERGYKGEKGDPGAVGKGVWVAAINGNDATIDTHNPDIVVRPGDAVFKTNLSKVGIVTSIVSSEGTVFNVKVANFYSLIGPRGETGPVGPQGPAGKNGKDGVLRTDLYYTKAEVDDLFSRYTGGGREILWRGMINDERVIMYQRNKDGFAYGELTPFKTSEYGDKLTKPVQSRYVGRKALIQVAGFKLRWDPKNVVIDDWVDDSKHYTWYHDGICVSEIIADITTDSNYMYIDVPKIPVSCMLKNYDSNLNTESKVDTRPHGDATLRYVYTITLL